MNKTISIVITEPTDLSNTKSVGCFYIENSVRNAGYDINYVPFFELKNTNADIYLFSIHHVRDMFYFKYIPSFIKDKISIAGGHCMNNPWPFLHYFDLICIGEGETWILKILEICSKTLVKSDIKRESEHIKGSLTLNNIDSPIYKIYEDTINFAPCYLNKSNEKGHKDTWYIEIGRGCKSKCNYCELGWTSKYREKDESIILSQIDNIDKSYSNRVNIFAPDDFSHTNYDQTLKYIIDNKLITNFGSMRYDEFENKNILQKKSFLFRIGVDGMSEQIRDIVGKKMDSNDIVSLISKMAHLGYRMFKFFMIFSYEFESETDFLIFKHLIDKIFISLKDINSRITLEIKFTPFIPNPLTPMEFFTPNYSLKMKQNIDRFFLEYKTKSNNVFIHNPGILESFSYYSQAWLARVDYEDFNPLMIKDRKIHNFKAEQLAKTNKPKRHIITNIDENVRIKAFEVMKQKIEKHYGTI